MSGYPESTSASVGNYFVPCYENFSFTVTASSWTPDGGNERKKKRKSRWAQDNDTDKTIIPGMPTVIPNGLSDDQEKQYLCKYLVIN